MTQIDVSVKMAKEAHEVASGLKKIVISAKAAADDGWQTGTDLPAVLVTAAGELISMVEGMDKLDDEWKEGKGAFLNALVVPVMEMVEELVKKEA